MLEDLKKDKDGLIKKRDELKALHKTMDDSDQMKQVTYMKIRKIEQDLETEYYKILEDKDQPSNEIVPSVQKPKAPQVQVKKYQEEMIREEIKRKQF